MITNFKEMFDMQKKLDEHINEVKQLSGADVMEERILALLVEIGEFANETRCFKFWSDKPMSKKEVVLFEFVDNVHFILSIGNHSGFTYGEGDQMEFKKYDDDLTVLFIEYFHSVSRFRVEPRPTNYIDIWSYLFSIARKMNFSEEDIYQAYVEKNKVNFERQASGY